MDLFSIGRAVWRHKVAVLPVILLTVVGIFYVVAIKPPVYQASSQVLLAPPQAAPTQAQIAKDPKLGKIDTNNPYADLGNLQEVADVVIGIVTSSSGAQALVSAGVNPAYQVALSPDVGSPPIIEITGAGSTPQEAIRSANLVAAASERALYQIQKNQGVNSAYMIKSIEYVTPDQAKQTVSSKLRTLIAVLVLGAILILVVVSAADAMDKRRQAGSGQADRPARAYRADTGFDGVDDGLAKLRSGAPMTSRPARRQDGDDPAETRQTGR